MFTAIIFRLAFFLRGVSVYLSFSLTSRWEAFPGKPAIYLIILYFADFIAPLAANLFLRQAAATKKIKRTEKKKIRLIRGN